MRALLLMAFLVPLGVQGAECTARSGSGTAALVELYTSEGCSSCPPAERWLSTLSSRYPAGDVVPLALHVDYWDYLGWKDPYAKREFALRQRKLTQLQRLAFVYTPQVMLQGRDFRGWAGRAFDDAVRRIHATPAKASLMLSILRPQADFLDVDATAELLQPVTDAAFYIAAYRSKLQSRVEAGENRGRLLSHDYVVLEWQGPYALSGRRTERTRLPVLPGATPRESGVAAFVQDRRTGEVLQALLRSAC